jgi:membrane-associated phospholipid phosphatase
VELKMRTTPLSHLGYKISVLFFFCLFLAITLKAESKRDTLINKAWRDTIRVQKAQIYELDDNTSMLYYRPKPFKFAKNVPSDVYQLGKTAFSKKNLPKLGVILAGSALLVIVDQPVTDAAQQFGRYINLDAARKSKTILQFNIGSFHVNAMEVPDNLNSAIYYLGEGWSSMLIAGGLYSYGLMANDYRALQTTSQIAEAIFAMGLTTQFLKRTTGRQSPFRAMDGNGVPGGDWHPLPNPGKYQKNVSNYDAFPSGHLATAMATLTILAGNYPDNKYIKPVGYSLMGLLGYAMINNGVHWISDYPLALAIGYTCGKIALSRGHQVIPKVSNYHGSTSSLVPVYFGEGSLGLSYRATF